MGGCLDAMMVARGFARTRGSKRRPQPWDLAPLKIIGEEAGLRDLRFQG